MSYYIDIIDTISPETQLVIEFASASGITLNWSGSDTKDEMTIVASNLQFDMLSKSGVDAAFINLFSGDETRFLVLVKNSATDAVIWRGHIVPDLYSEPYKKPMFVNFIASDGLGRLKGKHLPADYYNQEKSLIAIYCELLKLTGLEMDLYFNPAIENTVNKDWNTIYLDTATFVEKDKKQDAYKILETILRDTLCVCYQADDRWYIEGMNTRQIPRVTYKKYNFNGVLEGTVRYDRLRKNITALVTPTVTIIPPYNEINVSHQKIDSLFPETIDQEVNDGWVVQNGYVATIFSTDWIGNNGMLENCVAPDYRIGLPHRFTNRTDRRTVNPNLSTAAVGTAFISLRKKIYMNRGQRINLSFSFMIEKAAKNRENPENYDLWKNIFKYEILLNNAVIYSNFGINVAFYEDLNFDETLKALVSFDHIFIEEGLLDVRIYELGQAIEITNIDNIILEKAKIETFGFQEIETIIDVINNNFTVDKEIELTYSDDKSGMALGFRLARLKEANSFYQTIIVPVLDKFTFNGKFYCLVQLSGANLIRENQYQVYGAGANLVTIVNVVYNFNDGEQMVVETETLYPLNQFTVRKYAINDFIGARKNWEQWTDSYYKIERKAYAKTVANIYRRMFNSVSEKLDLTALNALKFNDLILFKYTSIKDFFIINCSWNLDANKTTITAARAIYADNVLNNPQDPNIPPVLNIDGNNDIYLQSGQSSIFLAATAYDPDGFIVSQLWEKVTGTIGDSISNPDQLTTIVSGLTGNEYQYKITVTDDAGATAFDFVNVYRISTYTIALEIFDSVFTDPTISNAAFYSASKYVITGFSIMGPEVTLQINGSIGVKEVLRTASDVLDARVTIVKNGIGVGILATDVNGSIKDMSFSISLTQSDRVEFWLLTKVRTNVQNLAQVTVNIGNVIVVRGSAEIAGLPISITQYSGTL
jgi:hypothetical protein